MHTRRNCPIFTLFIASSFRSGGHMDHVDMDERAPPDMDKRGPPVLAYDRKRQRIREFALKNTRKQAQRMRKRARAGIPGGLLEVGAVVQVAIHPVDRGQIGPNYHDGCGSLCDPRLHQVMCRSLVQGSSASVCVRGRVWGLGARPSKSDCR